MIRSSINVASIFLANITFCMCHVLLGSVLIGCLSANYVRFPSQIVGNSFANVGAVTSLCNFQQFNRWVKLIKWIYLVRSDKVTMWLDNSWFVWCVLSVITISFVATAPAHSDSDDGKPLTIER